MVRLPTHRPPTHPGELLREEFLCPRGITQVEFARPIGVPVQPVNEIVNRKRGVTAATALRFEAALGASAQFWLNAQTALKHLAPDAFAGREGHPPHSAIQRRVGGSGFPFNRSKSNAHRRQPQIGELNALNAALAVVRFKQKMVCSTGTSKAAPIFSKSARLTSITMLAGDVQSR